MPPTKADYVRTDELDGTLVSLEDLRSYYGVSRRTLERWIEADNITTHALPSSTGAGRERGVRWADLRNLPTHATRWKRQGT